MEALHPEEHHTIVRTKLHQPRRPSEYIPRPRLIELLEANPRRAFTLVSAPAGYGKSSLVSSWLEGAEDKVAWLSLDEEDRDLGAFLTYFVAAVRTHSPKACRHTHDLLGAADLPPASILADSLCNELDSIQRRFTLVLDDFHCVDAREINELVGSLLRHPPRSLHLVVVTRRDPAISFARLRATGGIVEIREGDLRFGREETRLLIEAVAGAALNEENLSHLHSEVEGWIVGLRLVCLALRGKDDPETFLAGFKGGTNTIKDYLVEEVIAKQEPVVQDCLIKISLLDRFCAPLIDALSTSADRSTVQIVGKEIIDTFQRSNLFVIRLDEEGEWFRYHHLFQDFLREELKRRYRSAEITDLHSRASEWFGEQGQIEEAIKHALLAGDVLTAVGIVEQNRHAALNADRWQLLDGWLKRLPLQTRQGQPHLLLSQAWIQLMTARVAGIPPLIEKVESLLATDSSDLELLAELNFFRGLFCYLQHQTAASLGFLSQSIELSANSSFTLLKAEAEYWVCLALHQNGQRETAIRRLEARIGDRDSHEGMFLSRLTFGLCFIHLLDAEYSRALQQGARLGQVSERGRLSHAAIWADYVQGNAAFQMYDLGVAERHFRRVMKNRHAANQQPAVDAMVGLAISCQFQGKSDEADATMTLALEYAQWTNQIAYLELVRSGQARLALLRGDLDATSRWQESLVAIPGEPLMLFFLEIILLTECRVLTAIGTDAGLEAAMAKLEDLRKNSKARHNTYLIIEAMVLQSLAMRRQGREIEALKLLQETVEIAAPRRSIRPFVESGQPMVELLKRLRDGKGDAAQIERILAEFPIPKGAGTQALPPSPARDQPLIEPLTNRELDVLELLAKRMYDKEIAEALSVSLATVKTHLKHIYSKLDVPGRRQAVIQAEQLGILKS